MNKEQIVEFNTPDPFTICDRLRGIYPSTVATEVSGVYPTSPIQKEAASEIERLRALLVEFGCNWQDFSQKEVNQS